MKNMGFVFGLLVFLAGAASHVPQLTLPVNPQDITVQFLEGVFSLDVLLLSVGAFIMVLSFLLHKLIGE